MSSLYTEEIKRYIHAQRWPSGLLFEVEEFDEFLRLKFFRENINALDGVDKLYLAKLLNGVLWHIRGEGIPIYTEVAVGNGR